MRRALQRSAVALGTLCLVIVCGFLPHLDVYGNKRHHRYTLFNTEDISNAAVTTLEMVGGRLPEDIDVYRLYSISVHTHLCMFSWIVASMYRHGVQTPRWYKYIVCALCATGLVTSLLFIFLADMFSSEGTSNVKKDAFLSKEPIEQTHKFLGERTFAGHLFQYLCFLVALACYLLERKGNSLTSA